jgi:hypothetical protein
MRYELEHGRPKFLVFLGKNAETLMNHLRACGLIPPVPDSKRIYHYTYITAKPQGKFGPGHPERISIWSEQIAQVAHEYMNSS